VHLAQHLQQGTAGTAGTSSMAGQRRHALQVRQAGQAGEQGSWGSLRLQERREQERCAGGQAATQAGRALTRCTYRL
jgi:hypothetical protein